MTKKPTPIYADARNTPAVRKGYELGGYLKNREEIEEWERKNGCANAQDASEDASLLDTSSNSPTHGQEDFRTLLGQIAAMTEELQKLSASTVRTAQLVEQLVNAMAEDQDPDEMPETYLDGRRV